MEALIPQLFILTVEASIVLLIVVLIILFFIRKSKKNDIATVKQLVLDIKENEPLRIKSLASILKKNKYKSDADKKATELHLQEKVFIQELLNVYLKRDIFRLDNIPTSLIDLTENFLKLASVEKTDQGAEQQNELEKSESVQSNTDNSKILEDAALIKEKHLKELSELRLKNTELNEHLFESLETITGLVTEHSKSKGGNDKPSAQQILDAIIFLRDQREEQSKINQPSPAVPNPVTNQADETLFAESTPDLGLTDILNTDLDSDLSDETSSNIETESKDDPWADALTEQSDAEKQAETTDETEDDPWADALAEQSDAEKQVETADETEDEPEDDPWAEALAEQSDAEKQVETPDEQEADPWADALAEQSDAEKQVETPDEQEADPWAEALAEQSDAEKQAETPDEQEDDPWADALAEQSDAEKQAETPDEIEDDPWADALAEQSDAEKQSSTDEKSDDDLWSEALSEQADSKKEN